ncbi:MAG: hypothetical protein ACYS21_13060 [Planctomycetota bacterium]|jgi:hypothetical protein
MSFLPALNLPEMPIAPSPWETVEITDFSGGLNSAFPESAIRDNQFSQLSNYYITEFGTLETRGPFRPLDSASSKESIVQDSADGDAVPLNFTWVALGATDYCVASMDAGTTYEVSYWDSSNNRWAGAGGGTSIKTGLTDGYSVEFAKFSVNEAEDLIFANGKDTPQRWTGSGGASGLGLTVFAGCSNVTESSAATANIRGIQYDGTYYYKFSCNYDTSGTNTIYGESGPSSNSGTANSTSGVPVTGVAGEGTSLAVKITLDNIYHTAANTKPANSNRIYIYRSPPNEPNGPFKRVGYTTTTTFVDAMPVGEEGVEIPADAGTPPKLKHPYVFKGRLWGVGVNSSGALTNKGVYSEVGQPDMFPALNYFYLPDPIKGYIAFKENLYIWTEKQIYTIPNGDVTTYSDPIKVSERGCTARGSIVDVGLGVVWQGEDNVYWADFNTRAKDGDFPIPVGDPIRDKIDEIPSTGTDYRANSRATFYKERYYLCITSPNSTVNDRILVWNVTVGTALLSQNLTGGWSMLDVDANDIVNFKGILYTSDNTNKYIMEHDWAGTGDCINYTNYAADPKTDVNISTLLRTKRTYLGSPWTEKIIRSLSLVGESSAVVLKAKLDLNRGEYTKHQSFTMGTDTMAVENDWLIWDTGKWASTSTSNDGDNWANETCVYQADHKKFIGGAKGKNVQLTLSSDDSGDTKLSHLKIYYKVLPQPA